MNKKVILSILGTIIGGIFSTILITHNYNSHEYNNNQFLISDCSINQDNGGSANVGSTVRGQSFKAECCGFIKSVKIDLEIAPATMTLSIYEGLFCTGTLLKTETFTAVEGYNEYEFTCDYPQVKSGTLYSYKTEWSGISRMVNTYDSPYTDGMLLNSICESQGNRDQKFDIKIISM